MAIPSDVEKIIRHKAAVDWPGDYSMQAHTVQSQRDAYERLAHYEATLDLSNEIISTSFTKARADWVDDYEMQVHTFENQTDAAIKFFDNVDAALPSETLEEIRARAFSEWLGDYEMMLHTLEEQIAAWKSLNL
ncbi:hypothetical protein [Bosea vaviloviae]|uniref:Uncharacterized protein n=1 Tax=Bosea vaviloviae TaxID=1526658 RepID=A0A0N1N0S8_9HYPH|nr:hypothetical protein [Bosea vaviloviae]KPH77540.1 hypothetical protein AE618_22400 [Bosea vaviloviae]